MHQTLYKDGEYSSVRTQQSSLEVSSQGSKERLKPPLRALRTDSMTLNATPNYQSYGR